MSDHLIIAVHGIGEQKPGETINEITGAAIAEVPPHERHPVEIERDVIELVEDGFTPEKRRAKLFPVHLRRVKKAMPGDDDDDDALFVEVYWADKSPAPKGPFWTAFDLLRVVLGLGYLAMENAESNRDFFPIGLVHLFTWIFYGLIAPVNAALLIGVVILLIDLTPVFTVGDNFPVRWVFYLHGVFTFIVGLYVWLRVARTYLVRIFGRGMTLLGVAISLVAVSASLGIQIPTDWCEPVPEQELMRFLPSLDCYTAGSISVLSISWVMAVLIAVLNYPVSWFSRPRPAPEDGISGRRVIYPAICSAMIIFWMVSSSTLWLLARKLINSVEFGTSSLPEGNDGMFFILFDRNLGAALQTLSTATACVLVVLLGAVALMIARYHRREELYTKPEIFSRALLNPGIRVLLGLSLLVIFTVLALLTVINLDPAAFTQAFRDDLADRLTRYNAVAAAVLLALGVVIYQFSDYLAGGLGVVRDIVTYAIQDRCRWRAGYAERKVNFRERAEINNRFRLVLKYGLETVTPKYVTVLSHSQGTVIATQMLQDAEVKALLAKFDSPKVTLITMGSPVTHIYRRYFKEFFQASVEDMSPGTRWINIFRKDDFVGTRIDEDTGIEANLSVPAGGHTGYFTDYYVWRRLLDDVGLRVFPDA
ncbi:hypothetical protein R5H30_09060 [Sulfitobacter sp. D35]|uniref:hypothetical protein n=1 Tax=Sulfitobacter sp. D35 TaxID=3083252 RepID=UPI00296FBF81|nr:hypothetical protein [Sulfitobacter sp. D35]MDW4498126.1 hypothetical protein [Sulfitobacter sp. D35]